MGNIDFLSPRLIKGSITISLFAIMTIGKLHAQCSPFVFESYDRFSKKKEFSIKPLILKSQDYELHITIDVQLRRLEMKWRSSNGNESILLDPNLPEPPNHVEILFDDKDPAEYLWSENVVNGGDFWVKKEYHQLTSSGGKTTRDERLDRVWGKLKSTKIMALKITGLDKQTNYPLIFDLTSDNQIYFKSIINCVEK